jgi:hypothetical protein
LEERMDVHQPSSANARFAAIRQSLQPTVASIAQP